MPENKTSKFSDLRPEVRLMVLRWMRESLTTGLARGVANTTYQIFVKNLSGQIDFNPEIIWRSLLPLQRGHLEHALPYLDQLESEMLACAKEIRADTSNDLLESDPTIGDTETE